MEQTEHKEQNKAPVPCAAQPADKEEDLDDFIFKDEVIKYHSER